MLVVKVHALYPILFKLAQENSYTIRETKIEKLEQRNFSKLFEFSGCCFVKISAMIVVVCLILCLYKYSYSLKLY